MPTCQRTSPSNTQPWFELATGAYARHDEDNPLKGSDLIGSQSPTPQVLDAPRSVAP